ncbi:unannotated protein [freshwater metagenome]|uniref:Unannotated protein n=1 Tax=freshwater metagenome TaxID=449393 RepID=A0A6J7II10_9ZZZZ
MRAGGSEDEREVASEPCGVDRNASCDCGLGYRVDTHGVLHVDVHGVDRVLGRGEQRDVTPALVAVVHHRVTTDVAGVVAVPYRVEGDTRSQRRRESEWFEGRSRLPDCLGRVVQGTRAVVGAAVQSHHLASTWPHRHEPDAQARSALGGPLILHGLHGGGLHCLVEGRHNAQPADAELSFGDVVLGQLLPHCVKQVARGAGGLSRRRALIHLRKALTGTLRWGEPAHGHHPVENVVPARTQTFGGTVW